ncbi:histone-lysine N-methyltransferase SUV39H2 isoform X3 [Prionailurus viverrinus]|uniref:histone-lysine N-methyltransferase SUV39H2 isoform X2 n=2 Tax=Felinae TaxID=338152 RepID=UPI00042C2D8C|nr:histone-lysine N-methyltransferase SUV39H2 isoform X2 [Lynx canadensis]XP_032449721.1 histone-lysine N-methyltransferase SUV39H2 isoform X2 [Lynx canadensis]XP_043419483.1 histone-lysine N-methyltransferase SUV39H2 isoform X4 [Prionailurus bengalensis]XP_045320771.1 histone-lysine N-methyltransferase SUV39H2 isoform X5 [Leopardus geoffroyi]XP_047722514.1 histone-lysine N-methyltransferase SUV39H2 isoform X3 [Prionailurus viverrinus]
MEYYLVKWKGWPDSTNTWEPLQNLKCPLLLQQFSNDKHNYLSQVITSEEAERRGQLYDNKGITYLFDLDYESDEFTVDAARYGNVSHFVNHSCDPNLQVFNVFIDNLDTRLPRIALFSTRTINAGEELTFDYQMKGSGDVSSDSVDHSPAKKRVRTVCKCGAVTCRGYLN